jgi:aryl-alcohol dehydrogenase-like predicted oxidoreductase
MGDMETRRIGSIDVTVVGLGCNNFGWKLDEATTGRVLDAAIDAGVTLLDTADIYGATESERFIGRALRGRRDRVVLASKFGKPLAGKRGASPAYLRRAVHDSLERLQTDRIDLMQLHEPDPDTQIAETLAALDDLVREGAVVEIGCSNFSGAQLREADEAVRAGAARFVSVQNDLSLMETADRSDGLATADELAIAYLPYYPLANGLLTGKYRRGEPAPDGSRLASYPEELTEDAFARVDALTAFAVERDHTLLELAFAWLLAQRPVASVIAGATTPEQVATNASSGGWRLSEEDLLDLEPLIAAGAPAV